MRRPRVAAMSLLRPIVPLVALLLLVPGLAAQERELPPGHLLVGEGPGGSRVTAGLGLLFRGEFRDDATPGVAGGTSDSDLGGRGLFALGVDWGPYLSGLAELRGSFVDGSGGDVGLHQAWLRLDEVLGDWTVTAGRMEFELGEGLVVSPSRGWLFEPNAWDGARFSGSGWRGSWDLWVTDAGEGPAQAFDENFLGAHGAMATSDRSDLDLFLLSRHRTAESMTEITYAATWRGRTRGGLDWLVYGALQDGRRQGREVWTQGFRLQAVQELDHGHHVGLHLGYAKGDDEDLADWKRYDPVYLDQHRWDGRADLFAFSNLIDLSLLYWLEWNPRWSLHADLHGFWRQSTQDDAYSAYTLAPYGLGVGGERFLGRELDLYAEGVLGPHAGVDFGISWFSPSAIFPGDDQLWLFLQLVLES